MHPARCRAQEEVEIIHRLETQLFHDFGYQKRYDYPFELERLSER